MTCWRWTQSTSNISLWPIPLNGKNTEKTHASGGQNATLPRENPLPQPVSSRQPIGGPNQNREFIAPYQGIDKPGSKGNGACADPTPQPRSTETTNRSWPSMPVRRRSPFGPNGDTRGRRRRPTRILSGSPTLPEESARCSRRSSSIDFDCTNMHGGARCLPT